MVGCSCFVFLLFFCCCFYVVVVVLVVVFFVVVFFCFVFCGGFKGQVRWPEGPPHLALSPPYYICLLFFWFSFVLFSFLLFLFVFWRV